MNDATILEALHTLAEEAGVTVLHAIESGSRAWGFASPDSDYDVRFLYVHPLEWYLRIAPGRDTVKRMLPGDLDVSGWELQKALRLFAGSNVSLFEHLGSPITYQDEGLGRELAGLVPDFFNPIHAGYHYLTLARKIHEKHLATGTGSIKKLFYVLRPLMALRWIDQRRTMPPTSFHEVLAGMELQPHEQDWIAEWLRSKRDALEGDSLVLEPAAREWLEGELERGVRSAAALPSRGHVDPAPLNALLRRWIDQAAQRGPG